MLLRVWFYRRGVTFYRTIFMLGLLIFCGMMTRNNNSNIIQIQENSSMLETKPDQDKHQIEDENTSSQDESKPNQDEENLCNIPILDPFDPQIMNYVQHPKPLICDKVQPFLTFIDNNGYLRYNKTELKILKKAKLTFKCTYQALAESGKNDNYEEIPLTKSVKLSKDAVIVRCNRYNESGKNWSYHNVHAHPTIKVDHPFDQPTNDQLSVLIFLINSVSHSALQRNLPLTYNYTKNVMGMKYFTKMNKIGASSYPNQMAFLTGKRVHDEQGDMLKELTKKTLLNSWPFIFKDFTAKSYATTISEDSQRDSIFKYVDKGFAKIMVDYYYHNFWHAVNNGSNECFANVPYVKVSTDIIHRHMMTFKNKLQFIFSSISHSTHDYDNTVEQIDLYLMEFWKKMYEENYLNNTIVLFLSDHGLRNGQIRKTVYGLLEERLPYYGIWFPLWFYKKHLKIEKNIEMNLDRLTTPFDIYETLKDIVDANYDGIQRNPSIRGQSQLYPLPLNRTCKKAGIANYWCTCIQETPIDINYSFVIDSANFVIERLNLLLENVSDICQKINLSQVEYAKQLYGIKTLKSEKGFAVLKHLEPQMMAVNDFLKDSFAEKYVIGLKTDPFNVTFEATVNVHFMGEKKILSLEGDIVRTSLYEGLSDCIKDKFLKQYCPCFTH